MTEASAHPQHSAETLRRRRILSLTWAALAIAWAFVRALIAWVALGDYGLNPWIYLGVDLTSAAIDAVTTPKMVISFIDRQYRPAAWWGLVTVVAFVIPDIYLFVGTGRLPKRVILVIVGIVTVTFLVAVVGVIRRVRSGRSQQNRPAPTGRD